MAVFRRWMRIGPLYMTLALVHCFTPAEESPDTEAIRGSLSGESFSLVWEQGSVWPQGHCVDLAVTNNGASLRSWSLTLRLDQPVGTLLSTAGATLSPEGDSLQITPLQPELERGSTVSFQYCAEPQVRPVAIVTAERDEEPVSPTPDEDTSPTPVPVVTGNLLDEPIALSYPTNGSSRGGTCLELTISNLSAQTIPAWHLDLQMSGVVSWTDYWSCLPIAEGSSMLLYPGDGSQALAAYSSRRATVCLAPLVTPISMDAVIQVTVN